MRSKLKTWTAVACAFVFALSATAFARPSGISPLMMALNGEGAVIGVITVTSGGAVKTNANTAVPFTIAAGSVLKLNCDGQANICIGSSCSGTITNAAFGAWESDGTRDKSIYLVLSDSFAGTMSIISTGASTSCVFIRMG